MLRIIANFMKPSIAFQNVIMTMIDIMNKKQNGESRKKPGGLLQDGRI